MSTTYWLLILLSVVCPGTAQDRATTYIAKYLTDFPGPQVYKAPQSGVLIYVETDGRHVAAISGDGKLLWNRDPHADAHLPFYRTPKPQIVYIGPFSKSVDQPADADKLVRIVFNNSQFGDIRISDGEFQFQGQD